MGHLPLSATVTIPASMHPYGTRNSVLKRPPPPRRIKPAPVPPASDPSLPVFPLPGVMLHPDDASNKVFHAIGRSFLSVDNRAMTIKDLAETTLKYGLVCQNVSAASQAITTYIRSHMARCEAQQDHPLLLRHVLSGTLVDDDLVSALHSRTGGATAQTKHSARDSTSNDKNVLSSQGSPERERLTNFRRGTMVWYLSKAAGVSCPFARVGIRLCDYGKEGKKVLGECCDQSQPAPKKHDEAQCGEKRKRVRRGCRRDSDGSRQSHSTGRDGQSPATDSGYVEPSADSSEDERPPPKVKLTLRLRPSLPSRPTHAAESQPREVIDLSSDATGSSYENDDVGADDSDGADNMRLEPPEAPWSLPPYPRRSISVPCYTPTCDDRAYSPSFSPLLHAASDERRRSLSVPWSASPPPDSDHDDFDLDIDSDVDWDSSSLSAASPTPALRVKVETTDDFQPFKHEPDIRDMLDAWEDLDCAPTSTVSSATVKLPTTDDVKFDTLELWEWEFETGWNGAPEDQQDLPVVKMEPDDHECLTSFPVFAPVLPVCPHSPFTPFSYRSLSSSSSSSPLSESDIGSFTSHSPLSPFTLPTPRSPSSFPGGATGGLCALTWQDAELLGPDSVHPHEFEDGWASGVKLHAKCNLLSQSASDGVVSSVEPKRDKVDVACVEEMGNCRSDSRVRPLQSSAVAVPDVVVVRTCRPCTPDIRATQIEGISVYQTTLGSTLLLRRIDTDFVNLSTILVHLSLSPPSPLPDACVNVSHPSLSIDGIWAPLGVARLYAHDLPTGIQSIFLSDDLVMRFPTALQDFYQGSTSGRLLNQFGPPFGASLALPEVGNTCNPQLGHVKEDVWEASVEAGLVEEPLLVIPPSVNLALAALHPSTTTEAATTVPEMPLSPTEQEMFRTLCVHPDWETEEAATRDNREKSPEHSPAGERPLRRSRRVADAVAARSRAAPPRTKGSRHS